MKTIYFIVGGRPNYVKAASVVKELSKNFECKIIDLHQHATKELSTDIIQNLGLEIWQTIDMSAFSKNGFIDYELRLAETKKTLKNIILQDNLLKDFVDKQFVCVFGDMDAALIGALAGYELCIPIIHIEAGLRSFTPTQREEYNRIIVDRLASIRFCTESSAIYNLELEHLIQNSHLVGNTMIDTLSSMDLSGGESTTPILTMHRPENVDNPYRLLFLISTLVDVFGRFRFYMHPRTKERLQSYDLLDHLNKMFDVDVHDPLPYHLFIKELKSADFVVTDSGGAQEECAWLKKECYTLRESTERPSTVICGSNIVVDPKILINSHNLINGVSNFGDSPFLMNRKEEIKDVPLWDGKASYRINKILMEHYA